MSEELPYYTASGTEYLTLNDPRIKAERLLSHAEAEAFVAVLEAKGHAIPLATAVPVSQRIAHKALGTYGYTDGAGKVFTFAYNTMPGTPDKPDKLWQVQLQPEPPHENGDWVAVGRIPNLNAAKAA